MANQTLPGSVQPAQAYNGTGVSGQGFQLLQKTEKKMGTIMYDPDITKLDNEGDSALWLAV
jgi:hypothetical protein